MAASVARATAAPVAAAAAAGFASSLKRTEVRQADRGESFGRDGPAMRVRVSAVAVGGVGSRWGIGVRRRGGRSAGAAVVSASTAVYRRSGERERETDGGVLDVEFVETTGESGRVGRKRRLGSRGASPGVGQTRAEVHVSLSPHDSRTKEPALTPAIVLRKERGAKIDWRGREREKASGGGAARVRRVVGGPGEGEVGGAGRRSGDAVAAATPPLSLLPRSLALSLSHWSNIL
jgi:hypothetical protein